MEVNILSHTQNPETVITVAAKACYSKKSGEELIKEIDSSDNEKFIQKLISMGHLSPFEHASITFAVDSISRVTSHQLVRHRIASYSQKSQRYVEEGDFKYIVPGSIREDANTIAYYTNAMEQIHRYYKELIRLGVPKEDARYLLPNSTQTNIIITMNFRSLLNFFSLRCCNRAQWEIRELADEMLRQSKKIAPNVFKEAGSPCIYGACTEGKMSCGKPRRSDEWES